MSEKIGVKKVKKNLKSATFILIIDLFLSLENKNKNCISVILIILRFNGDSMFLTLISHELHFQRVQNNMYFVLQKSNIHYNAC